MQPDTRHRLRVDSPAATHVRVDVIPDGGPARLRVHGDAAPDALSELQRRWWTPSRPRSAA
jgi:allantoicase